MSTPTCAPPEESLGQAARTLDFTQPTGLLLVGFFHLIGDEEAKPVVAQLIRDAGFDPVDLGGIDDSQLHDPASALWTYTLTRDVATTLVARIKSGDTARPIR